MQECVACGGPGCNLGTAGAINCCVGDIRNSSKICSSDEDVGCKIPKGKQKNVDNFFHHRNGQSLKIM